LVEEMSISVDYWLSAEYKRQEARIVGDASPAKLLNKKLLSVMASWRKKFDKKADDIAIWFVRRADAYASRSVSNKLRAAGMTVNMRMTPEVRNVLDSLYETQVNLIKSIPQQYLTQVSTLVQESVSRGRDISFLKEELQKRYGKTERRARFIAVDQNNKASNEISRRRMISAGVKKGIVKHRSGGSKSYRHSHVKADGQEYDLEVGFWDSHLKRFVQPGELPGCKCEFRPVIE